MQYTMEKIQNNYERNWRVITNEHWNDERDKTCS